MRQTNIFEGAALGMLGVNLFFCMVRILSVVLVLLSETMSVVICLTMEFATRRPWLRSLKALRFQFVDSISHVLYTVALAVRFHLTHAVAAELWGPYRTFFLLSADFWCEPHKLFSTVAVFGLFTCAICALFSFCCGIRELLHWELFVLQLLSRTPWLMRNF